MIAYTKMYISMNYVHYIEGNKILLKTDIGQGNLRTRSNESFLSL